MPISNRTAIASDTTPERIRPYIFHGVDLSIRGSQANGDCPFCGRDGKFTVEVDTGLWRCFVCGGGTDSGGGNALTFLRSLHALGRQSNPDGFGGDVARDRRLANALTPGEWGVCRSPIPPNPWLIAGYGTDGALDQLYKRAYINNSWKLLPTPGIWTDGRAHAIHTAVNDLDPSRETILVCEGPWDGMALWECRDRLNAPNIIAVPGCGVWRDEWSELCRGRHVVLLYDSDHPRVVGKTTYRSGYDGMVRVARRLHGIAATIRWIEWGPEGYDPDKPSGWDLRDELSGAPGNPLFLAERHNVLTTSILRRIVDVPHTVLGASPSTNGKAHHHGKSGIEPQQCESWNTCIDAWGEAMRWRETMSDALATLLAVCASTQQAGNQLFLQLVGCAGSGKTTMCEGLLVSHHCHHLEHLTGFHSGWKGKKDSEDEDKDCSLIARINGKTLVTPEADVMMSSPKFRELMSQQRRIFDGKSAATYKNSSKDTLYMGLRTPWIMAGTPALMDTDQSQLGDRFIRFIIEEPDEAEKRKILLSALRSERMAMLDTSNGTAGSILDSKLRKAHALTGGYVNWLRANIEQRLTQVRIDEQIDEQCADLAELSADLRARPNEDKNKKENHDTKELPTRLARQNIRLAAHLAVVLGKRSIDTDVMRIVRKVALDTAHGVSLRIVGWMNSPNPRANGKTYQSSGGIPTRVLKDWMEKSEEITLAYLMFLRRINVLDYHESRNGNGAWALTERCHDLFQRVRMIGV